MIHFYQMEIHKEYDYLASFQQRYEEILEDPREVNYALELLRQFTLNREAVDELIDRYSDNWTVKRMAKVDLAIVRLSITEMLFARNVPGSVSINEAVNLSKTYSDEDGYKFINGLLGKILRSESDG
jgi:N utilization substance protein B